MLKRSSMLVYVFFLLILLGFGGWVWPLRWHYWTLSPTIIQAEQGTLPGPLLYENKPVTQYRENRFTHELQAKMGETWADVPERM